MIANKIELVEKNFRQTGDDGNFKLKAFKIAVPDENNLHLRGVTLRPSSGAEDYYYRKRYEKERIVMHFTIGNIRSDAYALTRNRVSVPF